MKESVALPKVGGKRAGIDNSSYWHTCGLTQTHSRTIVGLAAKHHLPAIYASREFVDAGV